VPSYAWLGKIYVTFTCPNASRLGSVLALYHQEHLAATHTCTYTGQRLSNTTQNKWTGNSKLRTFKFKARTFNQKKPIDPQQTVIVKKRLMRGTVSN